MRNVLFHERTEAGDVLVRMSERSAWLEAKRQWDSTRMFDRFGDTQTEGDRFYDWMACNWAWFDEDCT